MFLGSRTGVGYAFLFLFRSAFYTQITQPIRMIAHSHSEPLELGGRALLGETRKETAKHGL